MNSKLVSVFLYYNKGFRGWWAQMLNGSSYVDGVQHGVGLASPVVHLVFIYLLFFRSL